jgi:hypothetical protein
MRVLSNGKNTSISSSLAPHQTMRQSAEVKASERMLKYALFRRRVVLEMSQQFLREAICPLLLISTKELGLAGRSSIKLELEHCNEFQHFFFIGTS